MRVSPLGRWAELDVVSRNCITYPYVSPMFRYVVNSAHVEQATQIDMLVGSVANGLNSSGGFCARSHIVVDHQRINDTSFVFPAAVPALLAISTYEGINILRNMSSHIKRPTGKCPGDPGRPGPRRVDHDSFARCLAYYPHSPSFSGALVSCDSEGPEPIHPCSARATVVRYRG